MAQDEEGDIEVTCTGCVRNDGVDGTDILDGLPFETTVENLQFNDHETIGRTVRLWM